MRLFASLSTLIIFLIFTKNVFSLSNDYKLSILKKDLNSPWSISFINENEIIISEKTGQIKLYNQSSGIINEINHNFSCLLIFPKPRSWSDRSSRAGRCGCRRSGAPLIRAKREKPLSDV